MPLTPIQSLSPYAGTSTCFYIIRNFTPKQARDLNIYVSRGVSPFRSFRFNHQRTDRPHPVALANLPGGSTEPPRALAAPGVYINRLPHPAPSSPTHLSSHLFQLRPAVSSWTCESLLASREKMPVSRIAVGTHHEVYETGALKAALAEFISTLIFVFAGQGSGVAFAKLSGGVDAPVGLISAAIAHAFALFVAVSVGANISGGHVNPAVTFGAFLGGNITLFRGLLYWVAQLLGSTAACFLLKFSTGGLPTGFFALSGVSAWEALVLEIVMTFGLVYTVYATAVDPKKGELGTIAPIAIGFIVGANILVGGAFSGASMNPAVSFGPALVSWEWGYQWVYWVGPLVGGGLAGVVYELLFINRSHEQLPTTDY